MISLRTTCRTTLVLIGVLILSSSFSIQAHAATTCTANSQCPSGQVCSASKTCVASAAVTPKPSDTTVGGTDTSSGNGTLANPLKVDSLEKLLDLVLTAAINIGSIILLLALIWTGFLFVAARGREEKLSQAKQALLYTVIGGLILLGAKGIETVITSTVAGVTS